MTRLLPPAHRACVLIAMALAAAARAQPPAARTPPPRALGPTLATASVRLSSTVRVLPASEGKILVEDRGRRMVMLLDSALSSPVVIFDSIAGKANTFGAGSFIMSFRGDSILFYDGVAKSLVAVSASGTIGRTMALPVGTISFGAGPFGYPFSAGDRLVFAGRSPTPNLPRPAEGAPSVTIRTDDSALVIRMHHDSRALDTLAKLATGSKTAVTLAYTSTGTTVTTPLFPYYDALAMTSDGTLAMLHAHGMRVEWIDAKGARASTTVPVTWRPINDGTRATLLDSINTARTKAFETTLAKWIADSTSTGKPPTSTTRVTYADGRIEELQRPRPRPKPQTPAGPDEIPDYYPPTESGAVLADGDNNIWIRLSTTPDARGTIWTVVNRKGEVSDCVIVPAGKTVVGFSAGVVYLTVSDAGAQILEKVRWRS